jgi:hypothetical protein
MHRGMSPALPSPCPHVAPTAIKLRWSCEPIWLRTSIYPWRDKLNWGGKERSQRFLTWWQEPKWWNLAINLSPISRGGAPAPPCIRWWMAHPRHLLCHEFSTQGILSPAWRRTPRSADVVPDRRLPAQAPPALAPYAVTAVACIHRRPCPCPP